ncbi:hypothetical protein C8J56DRAFT_805942, partial [Mycena floridula]
LLDWISTLDFHATQRETLAKHAAATGEWFIQDSLFLDWLSGELRFLWCPGDPGVGKTILSSVIINHLERSVMTPDIAVVYIYCDYNHAGQHTSTQLLGSIVKQLVERRPFIPLNLLSLLKSCSAQKTPPSSPELMNILHAEVHSYSHVYLVVDALDECSEEARDLFTSRTPWQGLRALSETVHLLITSRDIPWIAQAFRDEPRIQIQAHMDDLRTYIKGRTKRLKALAKDDQSLEAEIIEQVTAKAGGMFLLARLHMDSLAGKLSRKALHDALSSLPKEITDSYDEAMVRIKSQGEEEAKLACQVFYWLTYAKRPLTMLELQHAVAVSSYPDMTNMDSSAIVEVEILIGVCAGLLNINWKETSPSQNLTRVRNPGAVLGPTVSLVRKSYIAQSYNAYLLEQIIQHSNTSSSDSNPSSPAYILPWQSLASPTCHLIFSAPTTSLGSLCINTPFMIMLPAAGQIMLERMKR